MIRKPNPTVTAETPRGSISNASNPRTSLPPRFVSAAAASPPTTRAISVAAAPYASEFHKAFKGATAKVLSMEAADCNAR